MDAKQLVRDTLQNSFDKERLIYFVKNLLNSIDESKAFHARGYVPEIFKDYVKTYERLGTYTDPEEKKIDILVVYLQKESTLDRARTAQRNFIARYLKDRGEKDAGLIAFVSPNKDDWRFSFVKMEYRLTETPKGTVKAKEEFTPARRYSFLVGYNESSHTAQRQLVPILSDDKTSPALADVEDAFRIEKVTQRFFEEYRRLFLEIKESLDELVKKDSKIRQDFKSKSIDTVDFAKKLLGQIVFLYFLQKKGWFGVERDADWGTGPKNFLRQLFEKKIANYDNFFNDILEPLFYEALAVERSDNFYSRFNCKIPFLNGGLFDPINNYDWVHTDIILPDELFSNDIKTTEGDIGTGILDVFDRYNFTVKEDEPLEKEVAVDPEMLGKVFENLLEVKDRKSKGTYYTPREIVHYMCQESLTNSLATEFEGKVNKEDIETLIKFGETAVEHDSRVINEGRETSKYSFKLPESVRKHAELIDEKLATIRVCDPAVGSGAFPVGMMNEVVRTRNALTSYIKGENTRTIYDFKRHAIQNCLYGVDIDLSAVEIAKLRLWLSLIVDEEDIKQIKPLPNLDYKIVQGNSLLSVEKNLFNLDLFNKLEELKPLFFNETNARKKQEYKNQIDRLISQITDGRKDFDFEVYFSEVFHEKKGFDVVFANPPYVKERDNKKVFEEINKTAWGKKWHQGKMDFWYFFLHRSIDIVKKSGVISFITSRYWLNSVGAKKLICRIKDELSFANFVDIGKLKVFDEVAGQHMVAVYAKDKQCDEFVYKKLENDLSDISKEESTDNLTIKNLKNSELFSEDDQIEVDVDKLTYSETTTLGSVFDISQGVVQNPDKVSKKAAAKYNLPIGEGVFVLSEDELKILSLTKREQSFVKKFFDENDIYKYIVRARCNKYLLYLTKENSPDILQYPNLKTHLEKYKKIMLDRRETKKGVNSWFHLHWPRKSRYFEGSKIILPAMFDTPRAAYQEESGYFGLSSNIVIAKDQKYKLKYILAILNSSFARYWFHKHGKKRGVGLDIGVDRLRKFPVRKTTDGQQNEFISITNKILAITKDDNYLQNPTKQAKVKEYEQQIDQMVYELYGLTKKEIKSVENFHQE